MTPPNPPSPERASEVTQPLPMGVERIVTLKIDGNPVGIDASIAGIVEALNTAGVPTIASCSGHGHRPGNIALRDGRELIIARDFDEARQIDALFPIGANGERLTRHRTAALSERPATRGGELGEALFALSDRLRSSGFLDDDANHQAYEKVVAAFNAPDKAGEEARELLAAELEADFPSFADDVRRDHSNMPSSAYRLIDAALRAITAALQSRSEAVEEAARLCLRRADDLEHAPEPEFADHRAEQVGRCLEARSLAAAIRQLSPQTGGGNDG